MTFVACLDILYLPLEGLDSQSALFQVTGKQYKL
jgi:hypothetical protein